MSAPAWTPGPWMVNPADAYEVAPAQPDGRIDPCLIVRLPKLATHAKANARLIASAPELYALLVILEWGDDERPGCPFCGMGKESGHLDRCQLNDALTRARGES